MPTRDIDFVTINARRPNFSTGTRRGEGHCPRRSDAETRATQVRENDDDDDDEDDDDDDEKEEEEEETRRERGSEEEE